MNAMNEQFFDFLSQEYHDLKMPDDNSSSRGFGGIDVKFFKEFSTTYLKFPKIEQKIREYEFPFSAEVERDLQEIVEGKDLVGPFENEDELFKSLGI